MSQGLTYDDKISSNGKQEFIYFSFLRCRPAGGSDLCYKVSGFKVRESRGCTTIVPSSSSFLRGGKEWKTMLFSGGIILGGRRRPRFRIRQYVLQYFLKKQTKSPDNWGNPPFSRERKRCQQAILLLLLRPWFPPDQIAANYPFFPSFLFAHCLRRGETPLCWQTGGGGGGGNAVGEKKRRKKMGKQVFFSSSSFSPPGGNSLFSIPFLKKK